MYKLVQPWKLILGSASPRRKRMLEQVGLNFTVQPVDFAEQVSSSRSLGPEAQRLALYKAMAFETLPAQRVLLTADTLVGIDGKILGKPASPQEACAMLECLSGRTHEVATGFCLVGQGATPESQWMESGHQLTHVTFRSLSKAEIKAYVNCNESMDKAGAYGVQKKGAALVESLNGSFHNVVGLPLAKVLEKLLTYQIITPKTAPRV